MVLPHDVEPIQHHVGRAIRDVVAVAVGNEQELRRTKQPDTTQSKFDAAEALNVVGEDNPPVRVTIAIGVFQDQDTVAQPEVEELGGVGVGVVFSDPQSPALSQAIATGFRTSGSAANTFTRNPSGTRKPAAASAGGNACVDTEPVLGGSGKSPATAFPARKTPNRKLIAKQARRCMADFIPGAIDHRF